MPIHITHIYTYIYMRCTHDDDNNNINLGVMMFSPLNSMCRRRMSTSAPATPTSLLTGVLNFTKFIYSKITKKYSTKCENNKLSKKKKKKPYR